MAQGLLLSYSDYHEWMEEDFMTECVRLADQARRAFEGEAWHGDALMTILRGVDAKTAAARPIPDAHSIWELMLHIAFWDSAVMRRIGGNVVNPSDEENFPSIADGSEAAWQKAIESVSKTHRDMVAAIAAFPETRLHEGVPGKGAQPYYTFFYMFAGIVQHELYHAGQIVLLKKAAKP
jgi:uncharacterized damage-inducible protein DinB